MKKLMNKDFKIVENFKWLVLISVVVFIVAIVMACTNIYGHQGMNIGIDYKGGAKVEVTLGSSTEDAAFRKDFEKEMKTILEGKGLKPVDKMQISDLEEEGFAYEFRLAYFHEKPIENTKEAQEAFSEFILSEDLKSEISKDIKTSFESGNLKNYNASLEDEAVKTATVGKTATDTLMKSTIIAIAVAIVVILIYIIFRFTLSSGLAAIIALAHDVLFMVAFTIICDIPVNSTFIAAVITIIGYSINATIVIFDKIRECKKSTAFAYASDTEIANYAIKHSFVKIMLSTLTTLVMVVALVLFSVATIREFIYPIIFGLIGGTFSSLCLSPSIWVLFRKIGKKTAKQKKA